MYVFGQVVGAGHLLKSPEQKRKKILGGCRNPEELLSVPLGPSDKLPLALCEGLLWSSLELFFVVN